MSDELLFTLKDKKPVSATSVGLKEVGLEERKDVEEWVIAHPQILGSDVLIVTSEFADWATKKGTKDSDRLDVLGLASNGQLVIAELKRGKAPPTIQMQALNYAARLTGFTVEKLAKAHSAFLERRGANPATALDALHRHASDLSDETLTDVPRIVLVATDFDFDVTTTAVFLKRKLQVEIELRRMQAYKTESGELVLTVSTTFPPPDMDDFVLFPNSEGEQEKRLDRTREENAVTRIIRAKALAHGTPLDFDPGSELSAALRAQVQAWVNQAPKERGRATWQNVASKPLIWASDGNTYSPSSLVKHMVEEAGGHLRSVTGTMSWRNSQGNLRDIADGAETVGS